MYTKSDEHSSRVNDGARVSVRPIPFPILLDPDSYISASRVVYRTSLRVSPDVAASHWRDFDAFVESGALPADALWCNMWLSEPSHTLYLFQPLDEPGVDEAKPARASDLGVEPVEISACEVGQVVFVPTFVRSGVYVHCYAAVIGKEMPAESVTA